jgi:hypothetical protein
MHSSVQLSAGASLLSAFERLDPVLVAWEMVMPPLAAAEGLDKQPAPKGRPCGRRMGRQRGEQEVHSGWQDKEAWRRKWRAASSCTAPDSGEPVVMVSGASRCAWCSLVLVLGRKGWQNAAIPWAWLRVCHCVGNFR